MTDAPVLRIRRVSDQVDAALMPQRFGATLLGVFSILAMSISVVGLYGAVAFAAFVPAWRGSRVDPLRSLRAD